MAGKEKGGGEEEGGGHSVGLWYVSFSDMITLLLSFFVMLTTFSSFSKDSLEKFSGACSYLANYSIFSDKGSVHESMHNVQRNLDFTETGSEKPTDNDPKPNIHPRESMWIAEMAGAYSDRRVCYIPSSRMFWGRGSSLTPGGRVLLNRMANYMRMTPCQAIVSENSAGGKSLERSYAVIEFFTQQASVSPQWFRIAEKAPREEESGEMLEIVLLAKGINP